MPSFTFCEKMFFNWLKSTERFTNRLVNWKVLDKLRSARQLGGLFYLLCIINSSQRGEEAAFVTILQFTSTFTHKGFFCLFFFFEASLQSWKEIIIPLIWHTSLQRLWVCDICSCWLRPAWAPMSTDLSTPLPSLTDMSAFSWVGVCRCLRLRAARPHFGVPDSTFRLACKNTTIHPCQY